MYLPGDPIDENEELEFDKSAYEMYHEVVKNLLNYNISNDNYFGLKESYEKLKLISCCIII